MGFDYWVIVGWRWGPGGRYGLGTACGIAMCTIAVVLIAVDLAGLIRSEPLPHSLGGVTAPKAVQVCQGTPGGVEAVRGAENEWTAHGWPELPAAEVVECSRVHEGAPDGVIRWRSCDSLRRFSENEWGGPCPANTRGATYARIVGDTVIAADVYIEEDFAECTHAHEGGHVRGFVRADGESAHSLLFEHLMASPCGHIWKGLDR